MGSRSGGSWLTELFWGVGFSYKPKIAKGSVFAIGTDPVSKVDLLAFGVLSVGLPPALVAHNRCATPAISI